MPYPTGCKASALLPAGPRAVQAQPNQDRSGGVNTKKSGAPTTRPQAAEPNKRTDSLAVELVVVRQWAPEQKQEQKKKKPLSDSELAKADRITKAGLKADAESGAKRSDWKKNLAETIGRDPAWVSNRIRKAQPENQPVPS